MWKEYKGTPLADTTHPTHLVTDGYNVFLASVDNGVFIFASSGDIIEEVTHYIKIPTIPKQHK